MHTFEKVCTNLPPDGLVVAARSNQLLLFIFF
jgi:hypothetical protein